MKKIISMVLALILMLTLAACGGGDQTVSAPADSVYKADVQAYITEVLDSTAQITIFEKKSADLSESTLTATCVAIYEGDAGQAMGTFILTYTSGKDGWTLDKCRVEMDESGASAGETKPAQTTPPETTVPAAPEANLSEDWKDFTFELGGHVYTLPCRYQEFVQNGWTLGSSYDVDPNTAKLAGYSKSTYVKLTNGAVDIYVDLVNNSGNARVVADCDIGSITIEASDNLGLKLAKGIHSLSTVEEIQAAYGTPDSMNSNSDYTCLTYGTDSDIEMEFTIWADDTTDNEVCLTNNVATERDATVSSTERPAYLDTYVAPGSMSNAVTSTQFELDGVTYHLPCPLSVFIDNGWSIKSDSVGYLGAGNYSYSSLVLQKGDVKFYAGLMNFAEVQVETANCAVYSVDFDEGYMDEAPKGFLKMPTGVTFDSTAEDLAKACTGFELYESSSSVSYTAEDSDYTWRVKYYLYEGTDLSIEIQDKVWDY